MSTGLKTRESGDGGGGDRGGGKSACLGCAANDDNSDHHQRCKNLSTCIFVLPKGIFFIDSTLGKIMSEFHLVQSQVVWQLLNYKK